MIPALVKAKEIVQSSPKFRSDDPLDMEEAEVDMRPVSGMYVRT